VPRMTAAARLGKEMLGWARALGLDVASDLVKGIPVLGALFKNVELQRRFREKSWEYTARVLEEMGELLQEIRAGLVRRDEADDLVIIIDNLDKMLVKDLGGGRTNLDLLFIEQLPKLEDLPVHMVVTFPVAFNTEQVQLRTAFASALAIQIPMVRLRARQDTSARDGAGFAALRNFLGRRLEMSMIFADDAAVDTAIRASGGCLRDLLRLVASAVVERGEVPINTADVEVAIRIVVSDLERVLQGKTFLPHLHVIARTSSIPPAISPTDRKWLLMNLIVLEYNGETWYDVHPLAKLTRAFRESEPRGAQSLTAT
jgi:hypothetical protein